MSWTSRDYKKQTGREDRSLPVLAVCNLLALFFNGVGFFFISKIVFCRLFFNVVCAELVEYFLDCCFVLFVFLWMKDNVYRFLGLRHIISLLVFYERIDNTNAVNNQGATQYRTFFT